MSVAKTSSVDAGLNLIAGAVHNDRGHDRGVIARIGVEIVATLLRKNADYGSSAFQSPVLLPGASALDGLQVRMSDKIARLQRLLDGNQPQVAESVRDTMIDLAGYSILWVAMQEKLGAELKQSGLVE